MQCGFDVANALVSYMKIEHAPSRRDWVGRNAETKGRLVFRVLRCACNDIREEYARYRGVDSINVYNELVERTAFYTKLL